MENILVLPPAGKRTKKIIIEAVFIEETEEAKNDRNEVLAKNFLHFGLKVK